MRRLKYEVRKTIRFAGIRVYFNRYIWNRKFRYQVGIWISKMNFDLTIESGWIKREVKKCDIPQ